MTEENKISIIPEGAESIVLSHGRAAKEAGVSRARETKTPKAAKNVGTKTTKGKK